MQYCAVVSVLWHGGYYIVLAGDHRRWCQFALLSMMAAYARYYVECNQPSRSTSRALCFCCTSPKHFAFVAAVWLWARVGGYPAVFKHYTAMLAAHQGAPHHRECVTLEWSADPRSVPHR
jgi:hypothetical protein